jgi:hypothetical protein
MVVARVVPEIKAERQQKLAGEVRTLARSQFALHAQNLQERCCPQFLWIALWTPRLNADRSTARRGILHRLLKP